MTVIVRLRWWRESRKMSQARLSELSGVRQPTISDIETGKMTNPGIETLKALADALDIEVAWLLDTKKGKG